ncbi:hypothetical protein DHEL01_v209885 [Diaporthe helianthi]|uniref:Uncharacterized protein n=1 Tax=Diaporthe helianthi TaxID=158607 RepID=A0A2P5HN80_DIAHE|nr:hypothetical protein DHEL01_v209885 [Diaporthe helianthi]
MGKDKRSRSRKPSENEQEPASRSASAAAAARVPLPPSSPTSESVTGDSSYHNEEPQLEPKADGAKLPQSLEIPQNQELSHVGGEPVLTQDDGTIAPPQIEASLGEIVEESADGRAGEDSRSPTNTDQSISPDSQKPSLSLDAELEGAASDGSDGDEQSETGDRGTYPNAAETEGKRTAEEAQKPSDTDSRQAENIQEEKRKREAAEDRVRALEAEMKAQQQKFEEKAKMAKKKHEQALQKTNQAREAEKMRIEQEAELKFQGEVEKFEKTVESLRAHMEGPEEPTTNDDPGGDVSSQKKRPAMDPALMEVISKEFNAGSGMGPVGLPTASKGDFRPGSARFLLAECEYLLDKSTPFYAALRATANYADGAEDWLSEEDTTMLDVFEAQLVGIIAMMEDNMGRPNVCLKESKRDWKLAMERLELGKQ